VYVVHDTSSDISVHAVDPAISARTAVASGTFQIGKSPECVAIDPSGKSETLWSARLADECCR